jgi:hypothetical protein
MKSNIWLHASKMTVHCVDKSLPAPAWTSVAEGEGTMKRKANDGENSNGIIPVLIVLSTLCALVSSVHMEYWESDLPRLQCESKCVRAITPLLLCWTGQYSTRIVHREFIWFSWTLQVRHPLSHLTRGECQSMRALNSLTLVSEGGSSRSWPHIIYSTLLIKIRRCSHSD